MLKSFLCEHLPPLWLVLYTPQVLVCSNMVLRRNSEEIYSRKTGRERWSIQENVQVYKDVKAFAF